VADFRIWDTNGDGLIAPQEALRVISVKAEEDRLYAIANGEPPPSRGGSRAGGPGGPGGKGGDKTGWAGMGEKGSPPMGYGKGGPPSAGGNDRSAQPEQRGGKGDKGGDRSEKGGGDKGGMRFGGKKGN
jgi:hypothetical protein